MTLTYSIRPYDPADLPAFVDLMNRSYAGFGIDSLVTPEWVEMRHSDPTFKHYIMVMDDNLIGGAGINVNAGEGAAYGELIIAPEHRREDVIRALIMQLEAHTLTTIPVDTSAALYVYFNRAADDLIRAFEARGYEYTRSSFRLDIRLDAPVEAPPLPDGIELRAFDRERDLIAAYEAYEESFSEHWGFHVETLDAWTQRIANIPGDDNSLWLLAWDGDLVAGFTFNRPVGANNPDSMWLSNLGVRTAYRKRGLGYTLLLHAFKLAQDRGYTRVGLGVDGSNVTGAIRIYLRAGMQVYFEFVNYGKTLRDG